VIQANRFTKRTGCLSKGDDIHHIIHILQQGIMEAAMEVSKWGNSLAVRLPKALVDELGSRKATN